MAYGKAPHEVVVVTGTGGMGMAIARRLGTGRHLVLAEYAKESLATAAEVLAGEGHWVHQVRVDISDAAAVKDLAAQAAGLGQIRAVVHTAGVSPVQASPARIVAVDVIGTALLLDAFEQYVGPGTVMVCIASMAGSMTPLPPDVEALLATTPTNQLAGLPLLDPATIDPGAAYGIAKRANQVRVQAASVGWGKRGGRVVSLSPGIISTPMGQQELAGPSGDMMRHMIDASATQRLGTPEDIASAVEFLVSPAASFITGTDLLIDGGVVAALRYESR
ncbi:MAG: SDR family oxidoreductase [Candidatus Limnocylindrales bacterium]|jgi:NAD(P)-dependent dehydrogenase (short-subunit alcohol dehydrogenase family)